MMTDELTEALTTLSPRERETWEAVSKGMTTAGAAMAMVVDTTTVETYIRRIRSKLDIESTHDLRHMAVQWGVLERLNVTFGAVDTLEALASLLPYKQLEGIKGPYLRRYKLRTDMGVRVYLHQFLRPDEDPEMHSHPWSWARSFVLAGGYIEERRDPNDEIIRREVLPGQTVHLKPDTYHRVAAFRDEACWTLLICGPKTQSWSFWNPKTNETTPWKAFIEKKYVDR